ncbi:MAG: hypothetical protein ACKOYM_05835 [Actinomycetes bacterium]
MPRLGVLRFLIAALLIAAATCVAAPTDAGAVGSGGASSTVTLSGDIVTTVIYGTPRSGTRRRGTTGSVRCWWSRLSDGAIEWLLAVGVTPDGQDGPAGALVALVQSLGPDALLDHVVQVERCNGVVTSNFRLVPSTTTSSTAIGRTMVTRLPVPKPFVTPPATTAVPVREPVFFSFPAANWRSVGGSIRVGPIEAEVAATPVGFRVVAGEPDSGVVTCGGPGVPFRPSDPRSALAQSTLPGRCTVTYAKATNVPDRPRGWLTTVTVLWSARWRTQDGPWRSLGLIPRTRVLPRSVREVTTAIETPIS